MRPRHFSLGALFATVAIAGSSSTAVAQQVPHSTQSAQPPITQQSPQTPQTLQTTQQPAQTTTTQAIYPPAQPYAPTGETETVEERGGPSIPMMTTGLVLFGASYTAAVAVAGTSPHAADQRMAVPIAGPWMALADRPQTSCTGIGNDRTCNVEATNTVLIVGDGVLQAIGVGLFVGSFLSPTRPSRTTRTAVGAPSFQVAPFTTRTSYGLSAVGTF
jgi:hypothetical protein